MYKRQGLGGGHGDAAAVPHVSVDLPDLRFQDEARGLRRDVVEHDDVVADAVQDLGLEVRGHGLLDPGADDVVGLAGLHDVAAADGAPVLVEELFGDADVAREEDEGLAEEMCIRDSRLRAWRRGVPCRTKTA